ncbi:MAG: hypothetical protein IT452_10825 [Planctomycetia bacterium]|nr:hypothetical protein [Planctomycetia bacterium]
MDPLSWTVRVAASGPEAATSYVRRHKVETGDAVAFDVEAPRVSALEQVLSAIGADLVTGLLKRAKKRRLEIDSVEAVVEGTLGNPLVTLDVLGEEGDPGLRSVAVRVYVSTLHMPADIDPVWSETVTRSPLVATFRRAADLQLSIKVTP